MASALVTTLPRSSCGKCVKVLKDLISGLDDSNNDNRGNGDRSNHQQKTPEPPPLTLLRAIARSSQQHPHHDQWGQELRHGRRRRQEQHFERITQNNSLDGNYATSNRIREQPGGGELPPPLLKIEETEDGVRLTIPVETTAPAIMKRWTQLKQQEAAYDNVEEEEGQEVEEQLVDKENGDYTHASHDELQDDFIPLATSVRSDSSSSSSSPSASSVVNNPLTIELKCRRCETTGPEAGARAFLMGPEPLSIVLCHNRIHSDADEVEEILTHELIHLYDVQTLQLDLADCETVAYSEVRAAREAECARGVVEAATEAAAAANKSDDRGEEAAPAGGSKSSKNKSKSENKSNRWPPPLTGMQNAATNLKESISENVIRPYCVRGIALGATQNMFPSRGKACLNKVWETAYADHRPFSRRQDRTSGNADDDADSAEQHQLRNQRRATSHSGTSHGTSSK